MDKRERLHKQFGICSKNIFELEIFIYLVLNFKFFCLVIQFY